MSQPKNFFLVSLEAILIELFFYFLQYNNLKQIIFEILKETLLMPKLFSYFGDRLYLTFDL